MTAEQPEGYISCVTDQKILPALTDKLKQLCFLQAMTEAVAPLFCLFVTEVRSKIE